MYGRSVRENRSRNARSACPSKSGNYVDVDGTGTEAKDGTKLTKYCSPDAQNHVFKQGSVCSRFIRTAAGRRQSFIGSSSKVRGETQPQF